MHLYAAFVPPLGIRQALVGLLRDQEALASVEQPPSARRGLFARRTTEPARPGSSPQLHVLDPERVELVVTDFGFLSSGDARRLAEVVGQVCSGLPSGPTVRVSGGAALVDPDDRSVWADLVATGDDVAALQAVAQAVVSGVQPLGFFCDRRRFRPRFPIATITDATTVEHLEQVLAALAAYTSEPWEVHHLEIVQRGSGVWRSVPIGAGA